MATGVRVRTGALGVHVTLPVRFAGTHGILRTVARASTCTFSHQLSSSAEVKDERRVESQSKLVWTFASVFVLESVIADG